MNQNVPPEDLLQSLANVDSNRDRGKLMIACIKATELARQKRFKEAIKELERRLKDVIDKHVRKKEALKLPFPGNESGVFSNYSRAS